MQHPIPAPAPCIELRLLGTFQLTVNGAACTRFYSDKVRALLSYLVVEGEQPVRREVLTTLLWEGYAPPSARASLRRALSELRKLLASPVWLTTTYRTVQLVNMHPWLWCDLQAFCTLATGCPAHQQYTAQHCPACLDGWQRALALYRGDFLHGFQRLDSAPFHAWRQARTALLAQQSAWLRQQVQCARLATGA